MNSLSRQYLECLNAMVAYGDAYERAHTKALKMSNLVIREAYAIRAIALREVIESLG